MKDLTGRKFSRLTALTYERKKVGNQRRIYWHCSCECGGSTIVSASDLTCGRVKSCKCLRYDAMREAKKVAIDGSATSGFLTYVREAGFKEHNRQIECVCICGNSKILFISQFLAGTIKSCGCYAKQLRAEHARRISKASSIDMSGRRFGRWLVLSKGDPKGRQGVYWNCRCNCGVERAVSGMVLRRGQSNSCGCLSAQLTTSRNLKRWNNI